MNLEYFYQLIQLFGVLLGLIGVFIIFKIENLDKRINENRNRIVTIIATHKFEKDPEEEHYENKSIFDNFLIYNGVPEDVLIKTLNYMIREKETEQIPSDHKEQNNREILFLQRNREEYNNLRNKRIKTFSSIKTPILVCACMILFGLSIVTYYNFESINSISDAPSTVLSIEIVGKVHNFY